MSLTNHSLLAQVIATGGKLDRPGILIVIALSKSPTWLLKVIELTLSKSASSYRVPATGVGSDIEGMRQSL